MNRGLSTKNNRIKECAMSTQQEQLLIDIVNLGNDIMRVNKVEDNIFDFKSHTESKGWVGKVGISFSGRAVLDTTNKVVTYWDMIKKSSSGLGGENMGFSSESYTLKGKERSGSGTGIVPGGEKYDFDYSKVRDQVRKIVEKNGWKFKTVLIKPQWWKGLLGEQC